MLDRLEINYNINSSNKELLKNIEEEIYLNKEEYYNSISMCHINKNVNVFIDFMLKIIYNCIIKTTQETTQENKSIKLNKNQKEIIKLIKINQNITRNELAKKLNITPDGVKYNLNKLIKNNIIERIGPNKGGYWIVKESDKNGK